jgi:superfamily I DNA/RNA helicase
MRPPSQQQNDILRLYADTDTLKVEAAAGSGKSSTLELVARRNAQRFLYLTFSKTLVIEAKTKFPPNVQCLTAHGLAFKRLSASYSLAAKLGKKIQAKQVAELLGIGGGKSEATAIAEAVIETVEMFCRRQESIITSVHLPSIIEDKSLAEKVVSFANDLWALVANMKNDLPISHDGYLKLYALRGDELFYDCILLDEAQDCNNVMLHIAERFFPKRLYVGDRHQQIYSWRGAVNALSGEGETAYLSKSFRFGQEIANFANCVLGHKPEPPSYLITGNENLKSHVIPGLILDADLSIQCAVIGRTRAGLLNTAFQILQVFPEYKIHVLGGLGVFEATLTMADKLRRGENSETLGYPFSFYQDWSEFCRAAKTAARKYEWVCHVFDRYGDQTMKLFYSMKNNLVPEYDAQLVFGTVHATKGKEFQQVILNDDFMSPISVEQKRKELKLSGNITLGEELLLTEEINLLYTGGTRAQKLLIVHPDVMAGI